MNDFGNFVEAHLIEISIDHAAQNVTLTIRDTASKIWGLSALGVQELLISEMRLQNIIDRITIWDSYSDPAEYRGLLESMNADALAAIQRRELILIELEPAYGASVLVVAKNFNLFEHA